MCHPAINIAMTAASTAMQAGGQYQKQKRANQMADYRAQVAMNNALTQRRLADIDRKNGWRAARKQTDKGQSEQGRARSVLAKGGVVLDQGTAGQVVMDIDLRNRQAADFLRYQAEREAFGRELNARNYEQNAALARSQKKSPAGAMFPTLVNGMFSLASSAHKAGMFKPDPPKIKNPEYSMFGIGDPYTPMKR